MKNKLVSVALALTTIAWLIPAIPQAATIEEIQASINLLLQQIATLQAQLQQVQGVATGCFTKTLKFGTKDAEVTTLQTILKGDATIYPEGLVTGYFGSLTEKAVKAFQTKYVIDPVGIVGPITRAKLNSLYCATATPTPTPIGYTPTATPTAGGLSVSLASDTPLATSVIYGSIGAQALASFSKFFFTAGTGGVKVTTLKVLRSGVSTNTDVSNVYIYDGDTRISEMTSIGSDNVVTFTNSAGLFTVAAGSSKTIIVKADIANATTGAGKTMRFGIASATDIVSDATGVSGTFPMNGNYMTWAGVADLGSFTIIHSTMPSAVDPSATVERELWRLSSTVQNQKVELRYLKFTMIGTANYSDLADLKLTVGASVFGPVQMASDKTVTFDLSASPFVYTSGQTQTIALSGKVIAGASRNFYFVLQNMSDIVVYDKNYGVFIKPNQNDTFAVVKRPTDVSTSINRGSLTVTRASDSPLGNVALASTNIELAKFNFTAAGENMKVMSLVAYLTCTETVTTTIKNVKLLVDGTQIGTTDSSVTCSGADPVGWLSFGNQFVVTGGQTKVVSIKGDLTVTNSLPIAGHTVKVVIPTNTGNVMRITTGDYADIAGLDGNTLTLRSGVITVAKNLSVPSGTTANPTAVTGQANVKIGSFTVTAGQGEAVDVTQFVIKDVVGVESFSKYYTNLRLKDSSANQIGSTYGTLTDIANTTYSFVPTTGIRIAAGSQSVFNIFADVKSGLTAQTGATTTASAVYATGVTTSQPADYTAGDVELQTVYVSAKGALTVAFDAGTPIAQQMVSGKTYEFARFKLTAAASEDIKVTDFVVSLNSSTDTDVQDLTEVKLYDVTGGAKTLIAGPVYSINTTNSTTSDSIDGYITFTGFNYTVPKNTNKVLSVEAKVSSWYLTQSADTQQMRMADSYLTTTAIPVTAFGLASNTQLGASDITIGAIGAGTMTIYRDKIAAAVAGDSPSGSHAPGASDIIFKFVISNESNEGSYSATLKNVAVTINATNLAEGTTHVTLTRTFTLYKDSVLTANKVAEIVFESASTTNSTYGGTLDFSTTAAAAIVAGWTSYTVSSGTVFTTSGVEIPAGGSKTFILVADTTTPKITSTVTSYLNPTIKASVSGVYGLTWADGDTSTGTSITTVDTLPLDTTSKTLSW